jgi:hypothetical protein
MKPKTIIGLILIIGLLGCGYKEQLTQICTNRGYSELTDYKLLHWGVTNNLYHVECDNDTQYHRVVCDKYKSCAKQDKWGDCVFREYKKRCSLRSGAIFAVGGTE